MKRILVIGDAIADVYRESKCVKKCPDAPTVDAVEQGLWEIRPGGAANVALNVAALIPDAVVDLIGIVDHDVSMEMKRLGWGRVRLTHSINGKMLQKERIIVDGELRLRIDSKTRASGHDQFDLTVGLISYFREVTRPDLIILSEYGAESVDSDCLNILLKHRDRLMVDTKRPDLSPFEGSLLCKLNAGEYRRVLESEATPERLFQYLIVTDGEAGSKLIARRKLDANRSVTHTLNAQAYRAEVVDVCGCGDTFMAGLAASLLTNDDPFTAMQFANAAAATVVSKPRTAIADRELTLEILGRTEK